MRIYVQKKEPDFRNSGNLYELCNPKFWNAKVPFSTIREPPNPIRTVSCTAPTNKWFFNEPIPAFAKKRSFEEAKKADLLIIIGTNAEVFPAAEIPVVAKQNDAKIIEINIQKTHFTREITDIFLKGKASQMIKAIGDLLYL